MGKDSKYQIEGERPLRTEPSGFHKFIQGAVWHDMQYTIKDRIDILTDALVNAEDMNTILDLRGQIKAWKEMLGLPTHLKSCSEAELTSKQKSKDED